MTRLFWDDHRRRPLVLERLEERLALAGFGPEDGAYFVEASSGSYESVAIQPADQKIVAAGPTFQGPVIARYDAQGVADPAYGSGGVANVVSVINSQAIDAG